MMGEILARHSTMKIVQATDGLVIQPNVIHLNPPRSNVTIVGNQICVTHIDKPITSVSTIDVLFQSLARDRGQRAIAVVLSGSGSDGSRGAEAIRLNNGVVLVQDPETAKFDGMPCATIARASATFIASPERIGAILCRLAAGETKAAINGDRPIETDPKTIILARLRDRYGSDFGLYKNATVGRRIDRRMTLKGCSDIRAYSDSLQTDAEELDALYHDILIGVTSFFRDREAFEFLQENVIPQIVDNRKAGDCVRVWVAACATGEEAYSMAIAFDEYAERSGQRLELKILATDVHKRSLDTAMRGVFPKAQIKNLDPGILARYFEVSGDDYVVLPRIRKYIVFSCHDITANPPFTRIDLVSCRNLLIYLNQPTQHKVLSFLHFAVKKDGYLMLGPSEAIGRLADEFRPVSETWRIYQKMRDVRLVEHSVPTMFGKASLTSHLEGSSFSGIDALTKTDMRPRDLNEAYDALLKRYAPAGFLVSATGVMLRAFGDAARYLDVTRGVFSQNLTDLLIDGLRLTVSAGMENIKRNPKEIFSRLINLGKLLEDGTRLIEVRIEPLNSNETRPIFYAVTIHEELQARELLQTGTVENDEVAPGEILQTRISELERDIATRELGFQSLVEQFETSNEELQATNEELMAANEELQSTNEELHSVNEELYTVSAEHQRKIEELVQLTGDMEHLLRSTNIGTIFVDREGCVRRFTPMATRAFNLIQQDIGRPLSHVTARFQIDAWPNSVLDVIARGEIFESEVNCDGVFFLLRVLPYRIDPTTIDGAVITLIDIDSLHKANARLEESEARFRILYRSTPAKLLSLNRAGEIIEISDYWLKKLGYQRDQVVGTNIASLINPVGREGFENKALPELWENGAMLHYPCEFLTKSGVLLEVELSATLDLTSNQQNAVCAAIDVTERNEVRRILERRNLELERSNESLGQYANMASHDLQEPLRKIKSYCSILHQEIGGDVSESALYAMSVLSDATDRMSMLVSSLLQLSRVSNGSIDLAEVDLNNVVASALSNLELELKTSGGVIEVGKLPTVMADRVLVACLFQNLIGNALKYRKADHAPNVSITAIIQHGIPQIVVTDDGIGFDDQYATVIFEPLRRLHGRSAYPGAGIGLAVVKKIVERHGWSIEATSRKGEGATFRIGLAPHSMAETKNA
jgi:two-component system CheB/CheR fusion protein